MSFLGALGNIKSLKRERKRLRNKLREYEAMAIPNFKMIKKLRKHLAQVEDQVENYDKYGRTERRLLKDRRKAEQARASITRGTPPRNVTKIKDSLKRHNVNYRKGVENMPVAEKDKILMRNPAYRNMAKDVPPSVRQYMLDKKSYGNQIYRAISIPGSAKVDAPLWNMYKDRARSMKRKLQSSEDLIAQLDKQQRERFVMSPGLLDIYGDLGNQIAANNPQYNPGQVQSAVARYVAGRAAGGGPAFGPPPAATPKEGPAPSYATAQEEKKPGDIPGWLVPVVAAGLLMFGGGMG